jgi:surfeit locus 1 family protein
MRKIKPVAIKALCMKTSFFTLGPWVFRPTLLSTLLILLIIPLFVYLGCWQLGRANTKQQLQSQRENHSQDNIITLENSPKYADNLRYQWAKAQGILINENQILLDNQIVNGRVGYRVITPLKLANSETVVLIDRGFIPIHNRSELPLIPPITGLLTLQGIINQPANPLALGQLFDPNIKQWPLRVQTLQYDQISLILKYPVAPLLLQLQEGDPLLFTVIPISFPLSAEKHLGYAIQWFMMALAVFIYYCVSHCQRKKYDQS